MPKTTKATDGGKRYPLNMRTTKETRDKIERAAADSGRSLAQEVEARLERSFGEERALGGRKVQAIVNMMAATFAHNGQMHARSLGKKNWSTDAWVDDAECYREAALSVMETLMSSLNDTNPEEIFLVIEALKGRVATHFIIAGKWPNPFTTGKETNDG